MIFFLNKAELEITRKRGITLAEIGWKEADLQELLFKNLDDFLPEDELLLIMQSRRWQEEPDLMAIDKEGTLYIFELKAWESEQSNLLQVLRYGQIYGQYDYEDLNSLFLKFFPNKKSLLSTLNEKFNSHLKPSDINKQQRFVLITNGLDVKTRTAIEYWKEQGVNILSWIYKIYKVDNEVLLEFETYRKNPSPYEDIEGGYYILNTNIQDGDEDDKEMLREQKASAYFSPWKYKIEKLNKGDKVFLYRSGKGIIAMGEASGKVKKKAYHNLEEYPEEEYYMSLNKFKILEKPISASEIKKIAGVNYVFMQTLFSIDKDTGEKLWKT